MKNLKIVKAFQNLHFFLKSIIILGALAILGILFLNFYLKFILHDQKINQKLKQIEFNQIQIMNQVIKYLPENYYLGFFKVANNEYETIEIINSRGSIKFLNPSLFQKNKISKLSLEKLDEIEESITLIDVKSLKPSSSLEILELIEKSKNLIEDLHLVIIKSKEVIYVHSIARVGGCNNDIDLTTLLNHLAKNLANNLN